MDEAGQSTRCDMMQPESEKSLISGTRLIR
jgi:hypothetical protein